LHLFAGILCLLFLMPIGFLIKEAFGSGAESLASEAFPMVRSLLWTSLLVCLAAVATAVLLGGVSAWLIVSFDFPGRRGLSLLLCLPFAIPPYLMAGIYRSADRSDLFSVPPLSHPLTAGVLLGLALYPWVYLPLKALLSRLSSHYDEIGISLGLKPFQRFWRIQFWLLLPTLGMTSLLVIMETLSDFGSVNMLGVRTLSVGIHDAMFSMYRRDWAAQLSVLAFFVPCLCVILFSVWQRKREAYQPANRGMPARRSALKGSTLLAAYGFFAAVLTAALVFPIGMLLAWSLRYVKHMPLQNLPSQVADTLIITILVAAITVLLALVLHLLLRYFPSLRGWRFVAILMNLNYALPSVMLAIAVLFLSTGLPQGLVDVLLSESVSLLVLAGCLAYMCFPFFSIQSGMKSLSPRLDDLCRTLKFGMIQKTWRIYLPLLRKPIFCGVLLVLVNMAKELPLSQVLQPFGFQSLTMRLYTFSGLGMLEESALYALCLIILVLYPVATLDRLISGRENQHA
jgi:iron(III) transport system permease protein